MLKIILLASLLPLSEPNDSNQYPYEGISGTRYQYDLTQPYDQIEYQTDIDAQLRDQIAVDPGISIDQGIGQFGGGVEW